MQYLKIIVDGIFSFATFMILMAGLFCYGIYLGYQHDNRTREQTAACYAQGMVLVTSQAGDRCVLPTNLIPVK